MLMGLTIGQWAVVAALVVFATMAFVAMFTLWPME